MICRLHAYLVDRRRRAGNGDGAREAVTALVDLGIGRHVAEIVTVTAGSVLCPEHVVTAEKLQSVLDGREWGTDVLELKVQVGQISEAVRAVVPQSMWAQIIRAIEELEEHSEALDVGTDSFDDDGAYDPTEFIDGDDEF